VHSVHLHYTLDALTAPTPGLVSHPLMTLLQSIEKHGSISASARDLGLSYRHVWGALKRWEQELGHELIVWEKGQAARLTEFGLKLMWAERQTQARLAPQIQALRADLERTFAQAFDPHTHVLTLYASHDDAVARLQEHTASHGLHLDVRFCGSVDAIRALNEGRCNVAGFHTLQRPATHSLAARTFKPLLKLGKHKLIGFAQRQTGWMVAPGNPLEIRSLHDVAAIKARFVNRERGSGTRILFDQWLLESGLNPSQLLGYDQAEPSHAAVAARIASGRADVGLGIQSAAERQGLDFVPVCTENYWLVCLKTALDTPPVMALRLQLQSQGWQDTLACISGYQRHATGDIESLKRVLPWWRAKPLTQTKA
jgi:putative molybdopterin biosynthesis protein